MAGGLHGFDELLKGLVFSCKAFCDPRGEPHLLSLRGMKGRAGTGGVDAPGLGDVGRLREGRSNPGTASRQ